MNIIAAVDANWGIGSNGQLLVNIPEDMKFFRRQTMGKVVVMGRKTYESLPGGLLEGRTNVILTKNGEYQVKGADMVHSLEELHEYLSAYPSGDIYIIGGASLYEQLLEECDTVYLTKIDFSYAADVYFPDLSQKTHWKLTEESEEQTYFDLEYYFQKYRKK